MNPAHPFSQRLEWLDEGRLRVGNATFRYLEDLGAPDYGLMLYKTQPMIEAYAPILDEFVGGNVIELGIHRGGSTAFFAYCLRPRHLLAVDWMTQPPHHLDDFLGMHGIADPVVTRYGVDQGDRATMTRLVDEVFGDEPLDLVVDDASHRYDATVSSFEVLFPRLRPGGLYIIEDWLPVHGYTQMFLEVCSPRTEGADAVEAAIAEHLRLPGSFGAVAFLSWFVRSACDPDDPDHERVLEWYDAILQGTSEAADVLRSNLVPAIEAGPESLDPDRNLGTMATELLLTVARVLPGIEQVTAFRYWVAVRRSDDELDPATFRHLRYEEVDERFLALPRRRAAMGAAGRGGPAGTA